MKFKKLALAVAAALAEPLKAYHDSHLALYVSQFQTQVNMSPAPAVAGDFASANPRASVLAGPGALVAGANGVIVGNFAWADFAAGTAASTGSGAPSGFVHREQQALITEFLGAATMVVRQGLNVTLHQAGDFWALNTGDPTAVNDKVYANLATGAISTGPTGSPGQAFSATGSISSIGTLSTLTISALASGTVSIGDSISGTGIVAGTYIVRQISGSTGSTGTYQLNQASPVGAITITGGGTVETKWYCMSVAAIGELCKISSYPLG